MLTLTDQQLETIKTFALRVHSTHIHAQDILRREAEEVLKIVDPDNAHDAELSWQPALAREFRKYVCVHL